MRRKIGFLTFLFIVLMAGTFFYVYENGNTFYAYINDHNELEKNVYGETVQIEYSQDGIVELINTEYLDNNVKLTFKAAEQGDTLVTVQYRLKDQSSEDAAFVDASRFYELHAGPLLIITEGKFFVNFNGFYYVVLAGGIWFLVLGIVLISGIRKMIKEAQFTYKLNHAVGMLIISLMLGSVLCISYYYYKIKPWNYSLGLYQVCEELLAAIEQIVYYTAPVILLFAIAMVISNLILLIREKFRATNILWLLLGILTATVSFFLMGNGISDLAGPLTGRKETLLINVVNTVFFYLECMLAGTAFGTVLAAKHRPKYNKKFILIPAYGYGKDGKLHPLLYDCVDMAITFYQEQLKKKGRKAVFVVSGRKSPKGINLEEKNRSGAEAVKCCLIEKDIPQEAILMADGASTVYENMCICKTMIEAKNTKARAVVVSGSHQAYFDGLSAGKAGLRAEVTGCKSRWYFWPNTWARALVGMFFHNTKQKTKGQ
ncbi:MAG: ElyC/SanA/YdcF family protein [Lachnospiraceae bacterium]|nr:ElyC/SanA/YdcF family protein [Lachnospiraceae bacterium]MDD3615402.1 ElyC/SanA/YdcF family protein [Lachnospiraceae bacterium]